MSLKEAVTLRETIGRAVHAHNLTPAPLEEQQHAVERITALGWVAGEGLRQRLGALLLRLEAGDFGARHEAQLVLAAWLATRRSVARDWKQGPAADLLRRFAGLLLVEWLHPDCPACGGAGSVPADRATANRTSRRLFCGPPTVAQGCQGSGRRRVDHAGRAAGLGLPFSLYQRYWETRFADAHQWLDSLDIQRNLQRRLSKRTVPPQR